MEKEINVSLNKADNGYVIHVYTNAHMDSEISSTLLQPGTNKIFVFSSLEETLEKIKEVLA